MLEIPTSDFTIWQLLLFFFLLPPSSTQFRWWYFHSNVAWSRNSTINMEFNPSYISSCSIVHAIVQKWMWCEIEELNCKRVSNSHIWSAPINRWSYWKSIIEFSPNWCIHCSIVYVCIFLCIPARSRYYTVYQYQTQMASTSSEFFLVFFFFGVPCMEHTVTAIEKFHPWNNRIGI